MEVMAALAVIYRCNWVRAGKGRYVLAPCPDPLEGLSRAAEAIADRLRPRRSWLSIFLSLLTPRQKERLVSRGRLTIPGSSLPPGTMRALYEVKVMEQESSRWWGLSCALKDLSKAVVRAEALIRTGRVAVAIWPGGFVWRLLGTDEAGRPFKSGAAFRVLPPSLKRLFER